jgi:DNA-binding response OmpR family regulator
MAMKYILIAEDDPDVAQLISLCIGDHLSSVTTHVIPNGALVPDAISARLPDLLILDVALPGLSGVDVFELVRGDPRSQGVPVLFLTGSPDAAAGVTLSPGAGLHRVMAKPFDIDELVALVDRMVDGHVGGGSARFVAA